MAETKHTPGPFAELLARITREGTWEAASPDEMQAALEDAEDIIAELLAACRGLTGAIRREQHARTLDACALADEYNEALAAIAKKTQEGE